MRMPSVDRLAIVAVLALASLLGGSCFFSLADVVVPGADGGSGGSGTTGSGSTGSGSTGSGSTGSSSAGTGGAGTGGAGTGGAGGASTGTGPVVVDCSWKAGAAKCGCYNNDHNSFYCGHAVIGAASGFYFCIPPEIAFQYPNDLLSCNGGVWSLGTSCQTTCVQQTGTSAPDICSTSPKFCGCYKNSSSALYCGHAVAAEADLIGCVPTPLAVSNPGALLACNPNGGVWSIAQTCGKGCKGLYSEKVASDTCCP